MNAEEFSSPSRYRVAGPIAESSLLASLRSVALSNANQSASPGFGNSASTPSSTSSGRRSSMTVWAYGWADAYASRRLSAMAARRSRSKRKASVALRICVLMLGPPEAGGARIEKSPAPRGCRPARGDLRASCCWYGRAVQTQAASLQAALDRDWYHTLELAPGAVTPG